ncbi:MAG: type II secretion system F family protein [Selenomonadaceae bacterium]|nr:type II secretion system F family protein [Selenomonadaceae bacterium]
MIIFVSAFTGFSVFVLLYLMARKVRNQEQYQTKVRLQNLSIMPLSLRIATPEERKISVMSKRDWSSMTFTERVITPIVTSIQDFFLKLAPRTVFQTIERYIILAGKQEVWTINKVILSWGMVILAFFLAGIVFVTTAELLLIQRIVILLILTAMGVLFPLSYIKSIIQKRQEKIVNQLPSFLDLLSVSVQAGLSFDGSVDRILRRFSNELMDEFRQVQKDMRLGLSKKEALHEMAKRCDIEEVYLFTTSVIQAERLGTSMSKTLIEQANNMRELHQQRIKAKALKAPLKILFPLVLFIFPTIFIIILLPPLINVLNNLNILPPI